MHMGTGATQSPPAVVATLPLRPKQGTKDCSSGEAGKWVPKERCPFASRALNTSGFLRASGRERRFLSSLGFILSWTLGDVDNWSNPSIIVFFVCSAINNRHSSKAEPNSVVGCVYQSDVLVTPCVSNPAPK
ncbi:hypothetical protein B296_00037892 [Ensete ventricosum]|uniref:Uncharacterized protein n=1 Tax=Ensete ventricosum TaxID=4639 RepID=A0A426ZQU3_ENSVE|nr:hypothetical protein B296_00037892 [Ensete ventricosum]